MTNIIAIGRGAVDAAKTAAQISNESHATAFNEILMHELQDGEEWAVDITYADSIKDRAGGIFVPGGAVCTTMFRHE